MNSMAASSAPANAEAPPIGEWEGRFVDPKPKTYLAKNPLLAAQTWEDSPGNYRIRLKPVLRERCEPFVEGSLKRANDAWTFNRDGWDLRISGDRITGTGARGRERCEVELKRVEREPPTLGLRPPDDAVVLFDGSGLQAWQHGGGDEPTWKITPEGYLEVVPKDKGGPGGDLFTKENFGPVRLHLEFRYPNEANQYYKTRGNSGVFLQRDYEVQILDSFGRSGYWHDCGAIYRVAAPKMNAAAPPGEWQTYDIWFHPAEFGADGGKVEPATITVLHNGIRIHHEQAIPRVTRVPQIMWEDYPEPKTAAPIRLQDHGSPVQFRNIWAERLD